MVGLGLGWWFLILIVGLTIVVFFGQTLLRLLKWGWFALIRVAIGALLIFLFNLIGQLIAFQIPLNPITAVISGVLGIPGVLALAIIKWLIIL
ncbi:pro-sigmaK processing inhibitor BofA family protein [Tepidibacillus infernus]|uniref:Pro-sigmaK processing inhibitor BofA n=1 Tax=Tepidibacillus decaturensis TaxID=1413211 RepID=A0A135L7L5_9BACI|nr:pro-sigmaK processing inhibitor BofA family protein [Tepidibacillus decaturensis]KXG44813.1 hypothetical protein U473_12885 [Tepidibacillus decaturensis]